MLALCAMQTNPEWRPAPGAEPGRIHTVGASADMPPFLSLWPIGLIAQSEEEAREHGTQLNLETHPPEEGWINHCVAVNTVPAEMVERVARDVT